jgi:hypothetical protein
LEVRGVPTIELTNEQVVDLVRQLPPVQQASILNLLLEREWGTWLELSRKGQDGARNAAARRGRDWDAMAEQEREAFIDELVHEDRQCQK